MRTIAALLFLSIADTVLACSCSPRKEFCDASPAGVELTDSVVLVGTVASVDTLPHDPGSWLRRTIHLNVEETFAGSSRRTFDVQTSAGNGGDCGPPFKVGDRYFVVAHQRDGVWVTNVCSGTRLAVWAQQEIDALHAWKAGRAVTPSIEGSAWKKASQPGELPPRSEPAAGLLIKLTALGIDREIRTGPDGEFYFPNLPPAVYHVSMAEPGWTSNDRKGRVAEDVDLTKTNCGRVYFSTKRIGTTIRGTVEAPAPISLAGFRIHAIRLSPEVSEGVPLDARTDIFGRFTVEDLEPGEYVLRATRKPGEQTDALSYYPGVPDASRAQRFRVERGQQINLAPWTGFALR